MNKQSDIIPFLTELTALADYYGKELSEGVQMLYWQALEPYDLTAVKRALWDHAKNPDSGQFMPKIADIERILHGRTQDQAAAAWSKVDRAVRVVGTYYDVVFDDLIIHRVITDMGGWIWFGDQVAEEWPFIAKNFENRYRGYLMCGEMPRYAPVLIGIVSCNNLKDGYGNDPPRVIGDMIEAEAVMRGGTSKPLLEIQPATNRMAVLVADL